MEEFALDVIIAIILGVLAHQYARKDEDLTSAKLLIGFAVGIIAYVILSRFAMLPA